MSGGLGQSAIYSAHMRTDRVEGHSPDSSQRRKRPVNGAWARLPGIVMVLAVALIIRYETPDEVSADLDRISSTVGELTHRSTPRTRQPTRTASRSTTTSSSRVVIPAPQLITRPLPEPRRSPEPAPEPEYIVYVPDFTVESPSSSIRVDRDWGALDHAVRSLPSQTSIEELVRSLDALTSEDWERTRAVYVWLTANIAYDTVSFFGGGRAASTPEEVFRTGVSVCQGYSDLFVRLATGLGLNARLVSGYAKGYGYTVGSRFSSTNHAWNAVQINDGWHLFDSTWGAGHLNERRFVREFDGFWFDPHPDLFLRSHLPSDPAWQLAVRPISKQHYESEPYEPSYRFSALWDIGFSDRQVIEALYTGKGLPEAHDAQGNSVHVLNAPLTATVAGGQAMTFKIKVESGVTGALINNGRWTYLTRAGDYLFGSVVPSAGELSVSLKYDRSGQSYYRVLTYDVR